MKKLLVLCLVLFGFNNLKAQEEALFNNLKTQEEGFHQHKGLLFINECGSIIW
jgi:hypothetical protein